MKHPALVVALMAVCVVMIATLSCSTASRSHGEAIDPTSASAPSTLRRVTMIEDPAALRVGERFTIPGVNQLDETAFSANELAKNSRAIVFAMSSTTCPLSNMYAPRVAALETEYASHRVVFVHVNVVDAEAREEMRQFARENRLRGPYLPDKDHVIAATLGPRTTTEVFLFDPTFTLIYRGAIDDQYGVGAAKDAPRKLFLRDALDSFLAGEAPKIAATWAPGCLVDSRGVSTDTAAPALGLTYTGRIAKIIDAHCVECHRPFGVAPFSLASHQDIAGRARMIEAVIRDGLMPPSHTAAPMNASATSRSPWVNAREIPADEKADLLAWLNSSRPVGDISHASPTLERPRGWAMGAPDLLLNAGPIEISADGPMRYVRSIVPTNLTTDRWVSMIECRPMKQNAIHHALVWLLPPGAVLPRVDETPSKLDLLFAYSPGQNIIRYDAGTARKIPAGSMLVVDLYARPMGKVMAESLRIGMKADAAPPAREVRTLVLAPSDFHISPGEARATHQASLQLKHDTTVLSLTAYMRSRGVAYSLAARAPGQPRDVLLDAPQYSYRWQLRYEYTEARILPANTTLTFVGVHDNSESNPGNPDPGASVGLGPRPSDEALFMAIETVHELGAGAKPSAASQ
jgi:thiol-disulfide isomerase/thioredoxin